MYRHILKRTVNNNVRYLKLSIYPTLFDDLFLVEKVYGSVKNKKPTGVIKSFFRSYNEANIDLNKYIATKIKKGYQYSE